MISNWFPFKLISNSISVRFQFNSISIRIHFCSISIQIHFYSVSVRISILFKISDSEITFDIHYKMNKIDINIFTSKWRQSNQHGFTCFYFQIFYFKYFFFKYFYSNISFFKTGTRPDRLPYKVNYMDSIQHMYIIAMINNQPSSKMHYTTVNLLIDI